MVYEHCMRCGNILETDEEKESGICEECAEEEEMNNLASAIIHTDGIPPGLNDF